MSSLEKVGAIDLNRFGRSYKSLPQKNPKKSLAMPDTVDRRERDWRFGTEKTGIMKLRSLFLAVAAGLLLTAAFVPRADAQTNPPGSTVVSYFNFENSTTTLDLTPDKTVAAGGDNPGGGVEVSTTDLTIAGNPTVTVAPGILTNRTTGDNDTANPGFAAGFRRTGGNPGMTISFGVNTQFYAGLSLSFAVNNVGNGYHDATLSYSINGGTFTSAGVVGSVSGTATETIATTTTLVTFSLPPTVNGDGNTFKSVTFQLTFTNGQSNGNNANESIFDNIQLTAATVVPEPATVWGGLLGVLGLCWFQRRRLIRSVRRVSV
jgi:hypothetical protein